LARQKADDADFENFLGKGAVGQQSQHRGGKGVADKGGLHEYFLQQVDGIAYFRKSRASELRYWRNPLGT
jgi:hypothetical protein